MSYTPEEKDIMRIRDIIKKSKGNKDKIISLSQTMANRITDDFKGYRRAVAADIVAREALSDLEFDVFLGLVEAVKIFKKSSGVLIDPFLDSFYKFLNGDEADSTNVNTLII